jgi:hypothetical protein
MLFLRRCKLLWFIIHSGAFEIRTEQQEVSAIQSALGMQRGRPCNILQDKGLGAIMGGKKRRMESPTERALGKK